MIGLRDSHEIKSVYISDIDSYTNRYYHILDYVYDIYVNNEVWLMCLYNLTII